MGFPSRTSRIRVFVSWKSCCEAEGWLQAVYIDGQEMYIDCDSRFLYILGTSLHVNNPLFSELSRNPLSFSELSMYTGGLGSLDSELAAVVRLQSEPQL